MCGIAGFIYKDLSRPAPTDAVIAMCDAIQHRGPDAASYYADGAVALGHRRLSILDLSDAGTQPMASHDRRYVIVFNGEIYNYLELRDELEQSGARFRTQTDTEVILEAYRAWGGDCVRRFNGMWAFALYDRDQRCLFLSRDRLGIKPFYYLDTPDAFLFASEIKAILTVRPEQRTPHWGTVARFITTGVFADSPETFYTNVRSLMPGHNAIYRLDRGALTFQRYWTIEPERFADSWRGRDPVEYLRELLQSSVKLHMRSDVPVGTCLSGGVDSSTLVCLMARLRRDPVHTFSGIYADKDCDEKQYVDAVNAHVPTVACPVYPEPHGDLLDDLAKITWHQDNPTAGPGVYTQYYVMRRACREVKVVLDGQGADELFAGYLPYFSQYLRDLSASGWRGKLECIAVAAGILKHWGIRAVPNRLTWLAARIMRDLVPKSRRYVPVNRIVHPETTARGASTSLGRTEFEPPPGRLAQVLFDHLLNTSLPALLHYEDRNSMAFSLEARVPFLDYRIVEFALSLDSRFKISSTWTKWVLRKAAENVLPAQVAWRRSKMGYPTPMARWLRQDSEKSAMRELLFSKPATDRCLFRADMMQQMWKLHQQGRDYSWTIYRAATLELWFRNFIDKWQPCPISAPVLRRPAPLARVA